MLKTIICKLTSQMCIPASVLNSAIMCTFGIGFELFIIHPVGQSKVHQVGLVLRPFLQAHQNVGAFYIGVDVASAVNVF